MAADKRPPKGLSDKRTALRRVADFLEYLLMLVVLMECNSLYCYARETVSIVDMSALFYRAAILLAAGALGLRLWLNPRKLRRSLPNGLALVGLIGYAVVFYLLSVRPEDAWHRQYYLQNFLLFLPLMVALFKVKQREGKGLDLLLKYSDLVCVLAALSLTVYVASIARPGSVPVDLIYIRWFNRLITMPELNLLDVCQSALGVKWQMFGITILRNFGFFTEPLMFALPLLIALFTELFLRDRRSRWRPLKWALLTATLMTVNATIGLMLTAAAWGLKIISACLERRKRWLVIPILVLAIAAAGVFVLEKGRSSYEGTALNGNSMSDHIDDYSASLQAFASEPLLGVGFLNEESIFQYMQPYRLSNPGLSNTLGVILGEGGLVLGLMCLTPFLIWFLYLFKRRDWRTACWSAGALGTAAGIIFKYHLLLIMLIAFGYSLPDFNRRRGRLRLSLTDTRKQREDAALDAAAKRRRVPTWLCYAGAILAFAALALFGAPLWSTVHALMRSHQFSMAQSPLRSFCFASALLLNGVALRGALRRETGWGRVALLLVWDGLYLLAYPALFSWVNTLLLLLGLWGELREAALLLAIYMVPAALALLVRPKRRPNHKTAIAAGAVAAALAVAVVGSVFYIDRHADAGDDLATELETIAQSATGDVYVNDLPMLYARRVKGVDLPTTRASGFEACGTVSIVFGPETECRELIDSGFRTAELSDGHLLYTNDEGVIEALSAAGTQFYRYYAFGHEMDLEWLAELNGLTLTEDGCAVVEGPIESLASGPYATVFPGEYTVEYALSADPEACAELPADGWVCRAAATRNLGETVMAELPVLPDAFDEDGDALVRLPFNAPEIIDNMEFQLFGESDLRIEVRSIVLRRTPSYITVTDYNHHRDPVRETYYNADGTPYLQWGVYGMVEQDYDMVDRVIATRYFDGDGDPVFVDTGYAEVRYTYNDKGSIDSASYYDGEGQPIIISMGYARETLEYDAYGNLAVVRFYDTQGQPVNNVDGVAVWVREYDESRQVVREEYFDTQGDPVIPGGAG